ncbi:Homeodomain-like superfamily protein [Arabidopsis thaliana]|nr:Homeodomain-like superfamily protein [Arabidopsis thaliana]AAL67103.1 AT3g04030/T11I18_14 [Arabidopsis thaliana]AAN28854.1 At3g04030/T11I18_14 [Arabidopsis thaliana]AEE74027.1 Homeodomain-like superfamily protein [Arabidopsis thaliana]|eukprot:NP_187053.2 Homeodomain-like superfamily protein [Arabidopsis thaliana]
MYYQNQHQGKNILSSSRMHITSERHPFLRGNSPGDSGLILSTDAKPRLKWTPDLHERFIEAVNQLGGADKATPKTIMKVMGIPGLTLYHLKSHLQKYRLSKNLNGQANNSFNKIGIMTMMEEKTPDADEIQSENLSIGPQPNKNSPIGEALQMQIEVQRRLHEQLELRIEAQGKYLQSVLEKAQETLGRQNLGAAGIEAAKVQLSELVSKVSAEYPNSSFLEPKELQNLCSQQMQTNYPPDCSLESCLTSSEGTQKNSKMLENNRLGLRTYIGDSTSEQKEIMEEPLFQRMELTWTEGLRGNPYLSTMVSEAEQRISYSERSPGRLSIGVGLHGHKSQHQQGNNEDHKLETRNRKGMDSTTELDLNTHVENYCTTRTKQFDLNGFSWN